MNTKAFYFLGRFFLLKMFLSDVELANQSVKPFITVIKRNKLKKLVYQKN